MGRCSGGLPDARAFWFSCSTAPGLPHPEECLRWGYSFRPQNGRCYYENWTNRDLVAYATNKALPPQWIVVAGTSRLRGVFLSAADHLLAGRRGEFETMSKCWGRMDVEVGNLRLTFQDFRAQDILGQWPIPEQERRFQCHNDKQASYDDSEYARNTTLFVERLFDPQKRQGKGKGKAGDGDGDGDRVPTHLVFEYIERRKPELYRDIIFDAIPPDWRGAATGVFFRSVLAGGMESPPLDRDLREGWVGTAMEHRSNVSVSLVDTLEIIGPWLRLSEVRACVPLLWVMVIWNVHTTSHPLTILPLPKKQKHSLASTAPASTGTPAPSLPRPHPTPRRATALPTRPPASAEPTGCPRPGVSPLPCKGS